MIWRNIWDIVKQSFDEFLADDVLSQAAALAYYSALGLAPTILLFVSVSAFLGEGTKQRMLAEIHDLVGGQAAEGVDLVARNSEQQPSAGKLSAAVSLIMLLFSASGIFAQLQSSLNLIWKVKVNPTSGVWGWIRARFLSAGLLVSTLFLLLISLVVSTVIAIVLPTTGPLWDLLTLFVSLLIFIFLFAAIFKYLPDAETSWRDIWIGATTTAILFAIGKYLIGLYLGKSGVASSYGAAGSLIALLVWVYYSSTILLFGAELTQVVARHFGAGIRPGPHALSVDEQHRPKPESRVAAS